MTNLTHDYIQGYADCLNKIITKLNEKSSINELILFTYLQKGELTNMKAHLEMMEADTSNLFDETCCTNCEDSTLLDISGMEPKHIVVTYGKVGV